MKQKGFLIPSMYTMILAVAAAGFLFYLGWAARGQATYKEIAEYRENEASLIAALNEKDKQREVIYRDRIKIVEKTVDACADVPIPADVLRLLPGGDQAKPRTN
jgi:hypothetical protein